MTAALAHSQTSARARLQVGGCWRAGLRIMQRKAHAGQRACTGDRAGERACAGVISPEPPVMSVFTQPAPGPAALGLEVNTQKKMSPYDTHLNLGIVPGSMVRTGEASESSPRDSALQCGQHSVHGSAEMHTSSMRTRELAVHMPPARNIAHALAAACTDARMPCAHRHDSSGTGRAAQHPCKYWKCVRAAGSGGADQGAAARRRRRRPPGRWPATL